MTVFKSRLIRFAFHSCVILIPFLQVDVYTPFMFKVEPRIGDTAYHVPITLLPDMEAVGERGRHMLHRWDEMNRETTRIGAKTAHRKESMRTSDKIQPRIHVR